MQKPGSASGHGERKDPFHGNGQSDACHPGGNRSRRYSWPDITPEAKELIDVPPGILAAYAGSYGPIGGGIFYEVAMSGGQLTIRIFGNAVLNELYPVAADNFIFLWRMGNASLAFTRDAAAQVDGLTINSGGVTDTAKKK